MSEEQPADMLARLGSDGFLWAQEFNKTAVRLGYSEMDEGWLIGWFANAIENSCNPFRNECYRLREENARLRKALKPFVPETQLIDPVIPDTRPVDVMVRAGELRAARAAIREGGKDDAP